MTYELQAKKRAEASGESRIPAILYGPGAANQAISIGRSDFLRVYRQAGSSALIDVSTDDSPAVKTLIKEVQVHPVTMEPIHVDFYQVRMDKEIEAEVPIRFTGESKAVKVDGGTLVKALDELKVRCLPANLPAAIEVDLSVLNTFEDSITVDSLKAPEGVIILNDKELTVVTVERPLTEEELKKLDESQVGDVAAVKAETEEKKEAREAEAAAGETGEGKGEVKKEDEKTP